MRFFSTTTQENEVCRPKSGINLYPFGSPMPGRNYTSTPDYRYGANAGSEKDDEIYGIAGSLYTTEFRELDTRLGGRWWSPDPIVKPWESPYAGFSNNPIYFSDPMGLDPTDDKKPQGNTQNTTGTWETKNSDGSYTGQSADAFDLPAVETCGNCNDPATSVPSIATIAKTNTPSNNNSQQENKGRSNFDIVGDVIGGAGLATDLTAVDASVKSKQILKYAQRVDNKVVSAAKLTAQNQKAATSILKKSMSLGKKLNALGGIVTAADVMYNSEIKASHLINGMMTVAATTGVGSIVAGVWFVADVGTGLLTGTSISERIDSETGGPLVDWDY